MNADHKNANNITDADIDELYARAEYAEKELARVADELRRVLNGEGVPCTPTP